MQTPGSYIHTSSENKLQAAEMMDFAKAGRWSDVVRVFETIPNKDVVAYTAVATAAYKCGHYQKGRALLEELGQTGMKWNVITYRIAIQINAKLRKHWSVIGLWEEMNANGIESTHACRMAILNAAANVGKLEDVDRLMQQFHKSGARLKRGLYGCVLKACRRIRNPERALETVQVMCTRGPKPSIVEFTIAMSVLRRCVTTGTSVANEQMLRKLLSLKDAEGLGDDSFFLEEYVGVLLGGDCSRIIRGQAPPQTVSVDARRRVQGVLEDAQRNGVRPTPLLRAVKKWVDDNPPKQQGTKPPWTRSVLYS